MNLSAYRKIGDQRKTSSICFASIGIVLLLLICCSIASAWTPQLRSAIYPIDCVLCRILQIFWGVASAVASLVIVLAGVKWIGSGEDPNARAQAKSTITHAIVGLIIVAVALQVVGWAVQGTVAGTLFQTGEWLPASDCATFC